MADPELKQQDSIDSDLVEAQDAINELYEETTEISQEFQKSLAELNEKFHSIDTCFNKQRRQRKKYRQILSLVKDLQSSNVSLDKESQLKFDETKKMIDELGKSKRRLGSVFLRGIIGHVSVKLWNEGERLTFKQEYNRFKEAFLPIHLLLPLIQLYLGWSLTLHQIQSFFSFYYYSSLAIRENILSVNGSRIEAWWIYHHYVTLVSALFFLLVSDHHPLVVHGVATTCNVNLLWQSMVMLVQNNYQRKRHYTRKVLAKKTPMDVRTTEVIDENPRSSGLYRFLIPALFFTYAFQFLIALMIVYTIYYYGAEFESFAEYIQALGLVICWVTLPVGNVTTLLKVLSRKNQIYLDPSKLISRKSLATTLFFVTTVGKSVAKQWAMYGMHFFKSIRVQSSKLAAMSSRRSKKKNKDKDKDKDKNKGKDGKDTVTTKKKT